MSKTALSVLTHEVILKGDNCCSSITRCLDRYMFFFNYTQHRLGCLHLDPKMKSSQVGYANLFNAPCFFFLRKWQCVKARTFPQLVGRLQRSIVSTVWKFYVCKICFQVNVTIYILGKYYAYEYFTGDKVRSLRWYDFSNKCEKLPLLAPLLMHLLTTGEDDQTCYTPNENLLLYTIVYYSIL